MSVSFFDSYKFLVIPLWLLSWNPNKISVGLQKVLSTACITIHLTFFIICITISFYQHYDTSEDMILAIFFMTNMITCFGKHGGLFFYRKSFENVVDYFNNHLTPEEDEYQTKLRNKTKPMLKVIYPLLGICIVFTILIILEPIIQKNFFDIHETVVPMFKADIVTRSFTIGIMCLSSAIYSILFICFCEFITAHIDVLIQQISHIEYKRGYDKSELRKSLKKVMKRQASIMTGNALRCDAFYWVVFLQLLVSAACICFASVHVKDYSKLIFLPGQIIEICIFCYFGQRVENKSEEIAFAFYSTPWPEMDPSDRKLILVAIHNSQNALKTSGGPFSTLSHEALKNVFQWAYSFYAVLEEIK